MAGIRGNQARVRPVTAHPLFPTIVTLWFGALLGFGSLAVHPATLQKLLQALAIARVLPANLPPVNWTGRTLLAIALALVGCLIGLAIAAMAIRLNAARRAKAALSREGFDLSKGEAADIQQLKPEQDFNAAMGSVDQVVLPPLEEQEPGNETVRPILNFATIAQAFEVVNRPLDLSDRSPAPKPEERPDSPPLRSYSFPIHRDRTAAAAPAVAARNQDSELPVPTADEREETQRAMREALFYLKQLRGRS